jgi:hypothetical protein
MQRFRLPGEAQQIDRIMEQFSTHFVEQNPDCCMSAETAYLLAFSSIMLNTDLHSSSIPASKKMTLEQFIRNSSQGLPDGKYVLFVLMVHVREFGYEYRSIESAAPMNPIGASLITAASLESISRHSSCG